MKVRFTALYFVYVAITALLASWQKCFCAMIALAVHEASHIITALLFGERISSISFTPFGGIIEFEADRCTKKGVRGFLIAIAGPAANHALILLTPICVTSGFLEYEWGKDLFLANLSMMILNLCPALPLDGGRAVFCIGYCFMPVTRLCCILTWSGIGLGIIIISLGIYAALTQGIVNLTVFIVGSWIIVNAKPSRISLLHESRLAVLHERSAHPIGNRRVAFYCTSEETDAISLFAEMRENRYTIFYMVDGTYRGSIIDESTLIHCIIDNPRCKMSDAAALLAQGSPKPG